MSRTLSTRFKKVVPLFLRSTLASALAFNCGLTSAEDIEIYGGLGLDPAQLEERYQPNILFVLDTSTSMGATEPRLIGLVDDGSADTGGGDDDDDTGGGTVTISLENYDKDLNYATYVDNSIAGDSNIYLYENNLSYTGKYFTDAQMVCQEYRDYVAANPDDPRYLDRIAQWGFSPFNSSKYRWDNDNDRFSPDRDADKVECRQDENVHGVNSSSDRKFARNRAQSGESNLERRNSSPYYQRGTGNSRDPFLGPAYKMTLVPANYHYYLVLKNANPSGTVTFKTSTDVKKEPLRKLLEIPNAASLPGIALPQSCGGAVLDRNSSTGESPFTGDRFVALDADGNRTNFVYECVQRFTTMKEAFAQLMDDESLTNINVGVMRFNERQGATVLEAISDLDPETVVGEENRRTKLRNLVLNMPFEFGTPMEDTMYEAYLYFNGQKKVAGENSTDPNALKRDDAGNTTEFYKSPIQESCQANALVLLSDGAPSGGDLDRGRREALKTLVFGNSSVACDKNSVITDGSTTARENEYCVDEMAQYMARTDLGDNGAAKGKVRTFTIGFNNNSGLLEDSARKGTPLNLIEQDASGNNIYPTGYFPANDVDQLTAAFKAIVAVQQIDETANLFSAPAVTVNSFNRVQNLLDVYYAVFQPDTLPRWSGNIKRYRIGEDTSDLGSADGESVDLLDVNNRDAVDDETGLFKDDSKSYWSLSTDGAAVDLGGAAEKIDQPRNLLGLINNQVENLSGVTTPEAIKNFIDTTDAANINIGQDESLSGIPLSTDKYGIAAFSLGVQPATIAPGVIENNNFIGDSIHGTPYLMQFTENPSDEVIFFTTNQGLLHAIKASTGEELFAYVPDESLFENLGLYYRNEAGDHVYGLDGQISFDLQRDLSNGNVNKASLYFGQRRGGNKVFAVDVSEARSGKISPIWTITGGTSGFERLGQTWSQPVVTNINYVDSNGDFQANKPVIIFAGGYDTQYDTAETNVEDLAEKTLGNAVYVVDAFGTGELLFKVVGDSNVGPATTTSSRDLVIEEMDHSIVSRPTVIDIDSDGAADYMFFIDVSGRVFRVDFAAGPDDTGGNAIDATDNNGKVAGGLIADLSEQGVNRRFYNQLDATIVPQQRIVTSSGADTQGEEVVPARYILTTGSGYRARPLTAEPATNRLYFVFDENLFGPKTVTSTDSSGDESLEVSYDYANGKVIDMDSSTQDLGKLTVTTSLDGSISTSAIALGSGESHQFGYFIDAAGTSEKFLNRGVIEDFQLLTTSYSPPDPNQSTQSCVPSAGVSKAFQIDVRTGEVLTNITLDRTGISAPPELLFIAEKRDGKVYIQPVVIIGTEVFRPEDRTGGDDNKDPGRFKIDGKRVGKAEKTTWWEEGRLLTQ